MGTVVIINSLICVGLCVLGHFVMPKAESEPTIPVAYGQTIVPSTTWYGDHHAATSAVG